MIEIKKSENDFEATRLTHRRLKNGREIWVDDQNNVVYAKMTNGSVIKLKNKKIVYIRHKGSEHFYDDAGKLFKVKYKDGEEFLYEDDVIAKKIGPDGEELAIYDHGKLVYCKLDDGSEAWLEGGHIIRVKCPNGRLINCDKKKE